VIEGGGGDDDGNRPTAADVASVAPGQRLRGRLEAAMPADSVIHFYIGQGRVVSALIKTTHRANWDATQQRRQS
jgi:hypothetical protein